MMWTLFLSLVKSLRYVLVLVCFGVGTKISKLCYKCSQVWKAIRSFKHSKCLMSKEETNYKVFSRRLQKKKKKKGAGGEGFNRNLEWALDGQAAISLLNVLLRSFLGSLHREGQLWPMILPFILPFKGGSLEPILGSFYGRSSRAGRERETKNWHCHQELG